MWVAEKEKSSLTLFAKAGSYSYLVFSKIAEDI